jgi:hypothetical protein
MNAMSNVGARMAVTLSAAFLLAHATSVAAVEVKGVVVNAGAEDPDKPGLEGVTVEVLDANDKPVKRAVSRTDGTYTIDAPVGRVMMRYRKRDFLDFPTPVPQAIKSAGQVLDEVCLVPVKRNETLPGRIVRTVARQAAASDKPVDVFKSHWTWLRATGLEIDRKQDIAREIVKFDAALAYKLPAVREYQDANRDRLIEVERQLSDSLKHGLNLEGVPEGLIPDLCVGWYRRQPEEEREQRLAELLRWVPTSSKEPVNKLMAVTQPTPVSNKPADASSAAPKPKE